MGLGRHPDCRRGRRQSAGEIAQGVGPGVGGLQRRTGGPPRSATPITRRSARSSRRSASPRRRVGRTTWPVAATDGYGVGELVHRHCGPRAPSSVTARNCEKVRSPSRHDASIIEDLAAHESRSNSVDEARENAVGAVQLCRFDRLIAPQNNSVNATIVPTRIVVTPVMGRLRYMANIKEHPKSPPSTARPWTSPPSTARCSSSTSPT